MAAPIEPADLLWADGGPRSTVFDDVYFNELGGLSETRQVFLDANRLSERFAAGGQGGFVIGETGFGTGLNFLATLALWRQQRSDTGWLHYVAVEKHPLRPHDLERAQAFWPELAELATLLQEQYPPLVPGIHRLLFPGERLTLTLLFGDAATMLQRLEARVDAWFLDGFAPARNAEMWSADVFQELVRLSKPDATFSTYTAASEVRRGLQAAGFVAEKATGFGPKREMLQGHLADSTITAHSASKPWLKRSHGTGERQVAIIGAGIAGSSAARALAQRGWQVDVYEAEMVAAGASGNPAAIIYPKLSPPELADEHFQQQAFLFAQRQFRTLPPGIWNPSGVLWFLAGNQQREGEKLKGHPWPQTLVTVLDAAQATEQAGVDVPCPALHFPTAGWLAPQDFCRAWLAHDNIRLHTGAKITALTRSDSGWHLQSATGPAYTSPHVIIANAGAAHELAQTATMPLKQVRGQISQMSASTASAPLKSVLCYGGYLSPAIQGQHCLGASFYPGRDDTAVLMQENEENRQGLAQYLPELATGLEPTEHWRGRASLRCQSPDYLPLVGPLAAHDDFMTRFAALRHGNTRGLSEAQLLPGLYCSLGFGSKGFTTALLAAEVLAAEMNDEPYPVSRQMLEALHPHRLWVKQLKRRER